jgi:hypothetical protein
MRWASPTRLAFRGAAVVALLVPLLAGSAVADDGDSSFLVYAVNIHQTPMQTWGPGYGIYLGKGLFITAAHVAGHTWWTHPKVAIRGQEFPTTVVKEGSLEGTDVTLLSVAEDLLPVPLRLRRTPLCTNFPVPGTDVVTVVPEGTARSHIIAPELIPHDARRFNTAIADVATTGNSGSGVFDVQHKCLMGIMSRKISQTTTLSQGPGPRKQTRDVAKYFVPSTDIRDFIPPGVTF